MKESEKIYQTIAIGKLGEQLVNITYCVNDSGEDFKQKKQRAKEKYPNLILL